MNAILFACVLLLSSVNAGPGPCLQRVLIQVSTKCDPSQRCTNGQCLVDLTFESNCYGDFDYRLMGTPDCANWTDIMRVRRNPFFLDNPG